MHRSKVSLLVRVSTVAVVAAAVTAGIAEVTSAQALTGGAAATRTVHLVEKGGGLRFVDNPPKAKHQYDFSAGDIVIVTRQLFDPSGVKVGTLRLVCVAIDATSQQCQGTEALTAGTLELAGISSPAPSTTVAVMGGTGAYAGAAGTSASTDRRRNHDIADQTIILSH